MNRIVLFFTVCSLVVSCSSNNNETTTEKQEGQTKQEAEASSEFDIIGKWILYEDVDRKGFNDEKGTFIFQENGEVIMVQNVKNQKNGKYEFSQKFKTLSIEGEMVDIEIVDEDNILLKGKHDSGNKFVSQLVRQ